MKTIFSVLSLLIPFWGFSQKPDYLVKHNGDTLTGMIALHNKTFFVTGSSGNVTELNAADVKHVYSSKIKNHTVVPCKLLTYTDDLNEILKYHYKSQELDTVMVLKEVYRTAKMNLYWGIDDFKRQYYFYKTPSDSLPHQLYINYALGTGITGDQGTIPKLSNYSSMHVIVQKSYVNQLRLIMGNCKRISSDEWEMLDYRIYSFKALIKNYNKCK